jgi:membrane-associated phospholipid phosphatase
MKSASPSRLRGGEVLVLVLGMFVLALGAPRSAQADSVPPLATAPAPPVPLEIRWSHSDAWDYSLAGVGAAALIVEFGVFQAKRPPLRWTDPILFDTDVRSALRVSSDRTRNDLEYVSWGLWGAQLAWPLFVDIPYAWRRYDAQLARDLFWQDAVTLTLAGAFDGVIRDVVGRARPYVYECLARGGSGCLDGNTDTTRSFPGGHIVNSTAASVLTCTQHYYTHLYGGPWDGVTCAMTIASDVTLAALRIASDNHWVTDQIAGLTIGSLLGWGIPYVMHYRRGARRNHGNTAPAAPSEPAALILPMPMVLDRGGGLALTGIY